MNQLLLLLETSMHFSAGSSYKQNYREIREGGVWYHAVLVLQFVFSNTNEKFMGDVTLK